MIPVVTVTRLAQAVKEVLAESIGVVGVVGEVSGFRPAKGNMIFFELKDATSRVLCFMFTWELAHDLVDGQEIKVYGTPSLFVKSGGFHVRVQQIELVGAGALDREFKRLQKKLEQEGVFDEARKKPLPRFPARIGLITSSQAAARGDVLRVLAGRGYSHTIVFCDVLVQGFGAPADIVQGLRAMAMHGEVDVIILTRGGGSSEDLQAFNDEAVVRAVAGCPVPVVCAIGHERDTTLAELAADIRGATPSHAAQCVFPDRESVSQGVMGLWSAMGNAFALFASRLDQDTQRLHRALDGAWNTVESHMEVRRIAYGHVLGVVTERIGHMRAHIENVSVRLNQSIVRSLGARGEALAHMERLLGSASPAVAFARGYALVTQSGRAVGRARDMVAGCGFEVTMEDGMIAVHEEYEIKTRKKTDNI